MISLRIESLLLNNFIIDNKEGIFNEGYTFKGKILELIDNLILIDIRGQGVIQAKLETDVKLTVNDELSFIVKTKNDDEIILKPLINDKSLELQPSKYAKENNPISNLLKSINIKETKLSIELVENLMKYNAPLSDKNVIVGIKTLEKLFQLFNLEDDEKVILINQDSIDKDLMIDENITNREDFETDIPLKRNHQLIDKDNALESNNGLENNILENNVPIEKIDIKYILVANKDDFIENKDISKFVKEFLENGIDIESKDEYVKIISFLLKNNIKPSLNNIKNLRELNRDPIEFLSKLKLRDLNSKEDTKDLNSKMDFLKEMNKDLSFSFNQINYKEKDLDGVLTLIKEKKHKKNHSQRLNIYINLETHNLGNVTVSCQLISNSLSVRMNVRDKDLKLFKSTVKQLVEKISLIGYSLDKIDFVVDNNIELIDTIVSNPNPTYILDLKV